MQKALPIKTLWAREDSNLEPTPYDLRLGASFGVTA